MTACGRTLSFPVVDDEAELKKKCLHKWQDMQLGFSDSKPCSKPNWCKSHRLALVFPLKLFPQIFYFEDIGGQTGLPISDFV